FRKVRRSGGRGFIHTDWYDHVKARVRIPRYQHSCGMQWVAVVIEGAGLSFRSREGRRPLHAAGVLVARHSYARFAGIIPIRKNEAPAARPPHFTKMYGSSEVPVRFGAQLGAIIAKSRSALS
ncbi:hypothetical protein ACCS78_16700, partial [Rhizobium johnstonii]